MPVIDYFCKQNKRRNNSKTGYDKREYEEGYNNNSYVDSVD